jgi:hypothetical protein
VLTKSRSGVLLGSQVPTYEHVPPAKSSAGQEAVELAASVGLVMDEAQQRVLHGALGERRNGTWAAFEVGVIVTRQNLKTTLARVRQLSGLYLFGERLQTHTAHRADTCLEQFRYMKPLCEQMSEQMGDRKLKIKRISETNGKESIELMSGQRLQFKARVKESGRGFDGEVVYLDEAMRLLNLGDLVPTMSAQWNPQLWYLSSAPLPKAESDILRRLCRRGRRAARGQSKEPRLYYGEWCASLDPGPPPEADEDSDEYQEWLTLWRMALAEANPALGRRITEEFCRTEIGIMTWEEHARERLGIFPEEVDTSEPAIDEADWKACARPRSTIDGPLVLAFEVSIDRKWGVIAAAGPSTAHGLHVEVIENRRRTGWMVPRLLELQQAHSPTAILCNPSGPAGGLLPECEKQGLVVGLLDPNTKGDKRRMMTGTEYTQACQAAYDAIVEHAWSHIDQPELNMAATGAARRPRGDAFVFDRRAGIDVSPLLAVSIAAWGAGREGEAEPDQEPFVVVT